MNTFGHYPHHTHWTCRHICISSSHLSSTGPRPEFTVTCFIYSCPTALQHLLQLAFVLTTSVLHVSPLYVDDMESKTHRFAKYLAYIHRLAHDGGNFLADHQAADILALDGSRSMPKLVI